MSHVNHGGTNMNITIPADFPVRPLGADEDPVGKATCGSCGLSWDDSISTAWTPVPSGRCPFEYFHVDEPESSLEITFTVHAIPDMDADTSYLEQEGWEDRLEQYNAGNFGFLGVRAEAEVVVSGITQTFTSAGLWGIEDDSDRDYFDTIAEDELSELVDVLKALNIDVPKDYDWEWHGL